MVFAVLSKKKFIVSLILITAVLCSSIFFGVRGAVNVSAKQNRELPIYNVQTEEKKIAISFDCAWGVDYTDKLLTIMEKEGVKCTFFMVEFWIKKHPDYVKKIFDAGHEIGTHSSTHPYMSRLSKEAIVSELSSSKKAIEDITGKSVTVFRAPYGDYNNLLIQTAKELGLYTIQWDVDSLDWKDLSAEQIASRVLKKAKSGSIVLFHNQGLHTAEALPDIIGRLKGQGYDFVPIGELIYKDNYHVDNNGTQIKNS